MSHLHDKPSGRMEVVVQEEAEDMVRRLSRQIKNKDSKKRGESRENALKTLIYWYGFFTSTDN